MATYAAMEWRIGRVTRLLCVKTKLRIGLNPCMRESLLKKKAGRSKSCGTRTHRLSVRDWFPRGGECVKSRRAALTAIMLHRGLCCHAVVQNLQTDCPVKLSDFSVGYRTTLRPNVFLGPSARRTRS